MADVVIPTSNRPSLIPDRPISTAEAPRANLSGGEIAGPYSAFASALEKTGAAAETVASSLAEQAGYKAVTTDAQGNVQIEKAPIIGEASQHYARAVKFAAVAEGEGQIRRKDIELRTQFRDDPDGYLNAANSFTQQIQDQYTKAGGPEMGLTMRRLTEPITTQTYRGLLNEKERLDLQRAEGSITAGIETAKNSLSVMARGGVTQGPDWDREHDKLKTSYNELVANPRLGWTKDKANYELSNFDSELRGNAALFHGNQIYQNADKSIAAREALKYFDQVRTDRSLNLTDAQREAIYHKGAGEVHANEALRRQDIAEARAAQQELTMASALGITVDPTQVDKVAKAFEDAGDYGAKARLYAQFARKPLNDAFGRQPLGEQTRQLLDLQTRAQGVDPGLLSVMRRASEISGIPFGIGDKGGKRDQATQDQLVAQGFSQTRNSKHLEGRALDLLPVVNGKMVAEGSPDQHAEIARAMKQAGTELGIPVNWGGDWKSFKDVAHFELGGEVPRTASDPSTAIWFQANRASEVNASAYAQWKQVFGEYEKTGTRPPDKVMNDIVEAARATGDHDLLETVAAGHDRMEQVRTISNEPLPEQHAQIMERQRMAAEGQLSPGQAGVLRDLEKKTEAIQKGLENNPIATTAVNFSDKFKVPPPLDLGDNAQMMAGLQYRGRVAQFAAKNWGIPAPSALDSADLNQVKAALQTPDPAAKMRIFGAISAALPADVRNATLNKIAKDEPAMMVAAAASSMAGTAPAIAMSILRGQEAMKADPRANPEHEDNRNDFHDALDKALPASIYPISARTDPHGAYRTDVDMTKARYADLWAQTAGGGKKFNSDMLQQAVTDVTGGILSHNGGRFIAPVRGMSQRQFDGVMWGVNDADLQGVTSLSGKPIDAGYVRRNAQLESVGSGRYMLRLGQDQMRPIYAYRGNEKFVLDLRNRQPASSDPEQAFMAGP